MSTDSARPPPHVSAAIEPTRHDACRPAEQPAHASEDDLLQNLIEHVVGHVQHDSSSTDATNRAETTVDQQYGSRSESNRNALATDIQTTGRRRSGAFPVRRLRLEVMMDGGGGTRLVIVVVVEPDAVDDVLEALRRAGPPLREASIHRLAECPPPGASRWHALTRQEAAVAALAGRALTNQQIANRMGITTHTVNYHLRQVFRKLDIRSRVDLARLALGGEPVPGTGWNGGRNEHGRT